MVSVRSGWLAAGGFGAVLFLASTSRANPVLSAQIAWEGPCRDALDLGEQVRARGAELVSRDATAEFAALDSTSLQVEVSVRESTPGAFAADIELRDGGSFDSRRVEARECDKLRSAVAWLLVVLAQQRAPSGEPRTAVSRAAFPLISSDEPPAPAAPPPRGSASSADRPRQSPGARVPQQGSEWAFGSSLSGALGFVSAPALGPVVFGRYRPALAWLPTLQVSVLRLVTLGLESEGTSIALVRQAARFGVWGSPLDALHLGIAAEVGELVAEGYGSQLSHGSRDRALWFAIALPVRFSLPLVARTLAAELNAELAYSPIPYTFGYGSGAALTRTRAFEGRGEVGLVCRF